MLDPNGWIACDLSDACTCTKTSLRKNGKRTLIGLGILLPVITDYSESTRQRKYM